MTAAFLPSGEIFLAPLLFALVLVVPFWQICRRLGFHPAWSLLAVVPLVNVIALWVLAFCRWPALDETGSDRGA